MNEFDLIDKQLQRLTLLMLKSDNEDVKEWAMELFEELHIEAFGIEIEDNE